MKFRKKKITYQDVDFDIFPQEYKGILEKLSDKENTERVKAREELENIGIPVIKHLAEVLYFDDHKLRWEAAKTMDQMARVEAVPYLIQALEDIETDIRWIAAEGLTKLGRKAIMPLLEKLMENDEESVNLRKGCYHIFMKMDIREKNRELLKPLIKALNTKKLHREIPIIAKSIHENIEA